MSRDQRADAMAARIMNRDERVARIADLDREITDLEGLIASAEKAGRTSRADVFEAEWTRCHNERRDLVASVERYDAWRARMIAEIVQAMDDCARAYRNARLQTEIAQAYPGSIRPDSPGYLQRVAAARHREMREKLFMLLARARR